MIYDLIIVGSGSVGAAAGYYATRAGLKVLMIDNAHPPHDQGSHHGETRLIRHAYGSGASYVPMVLRAQQLWDELESLAGERIMHRCGVINIGPENMSFMRHIMDSARKYNLPIEIFTAQELMKRWPQINVPDSFIGVYESRSGYLKCEVAIRCFIQFAKEAGCTQIFNTPVVSVTREGDLQKVETINGTYMGHKVLMSAGTWLTKLMPELPVTPTRKIFSWHEADDRYDENNNFPGFVIFESEEVGYYGFPAKNNVLKLGLHTGGQPIKTPQERTPFGEHADDENEVVDFLHQFFPGTGQCLYGKSCTYDNTADGDFIIDTQPGEPNRMIVSGLSGHGFKFASVLGEIAVAFAQNKPWPFDLTPFSLSRFRSHK